MAKKDKTNRNVKAAKKFEQDLPEVAKRLHIRVSNPYGYYPEDVDKIILNLEKSVNDLEHENKELRDKYNEADENLKRTQSELTKLKMQISLMEFPDVSPEEDFIAMSQISSITGNNETQVPPVTVNKRSQSTIDPVSTSSNGQSQPATYDNLVGDKRPAKPTTGKHKIKL